MKLFWAGLATGIAIGALAYKVTSSDKFRNGLDTACIKCCDMIDQAISKAIEATS